MERGVAQNGKQNAFVFVFQMNVITTAKRAKKKETQGCRFLFARSDFCKDR